MRAELEDGRTFARRSLPTRLYLQPPFAAASEIVSRNTLNGEDTSDPKAERPPVADATRASDRPRGKVLMILGAVVFQSSGGMPRRTEIMNSVLREVTKPLHARSMVIRKSSLRVMSLGSKSPSIWYPSNPLEFPLPIANPESLAQR